MTHHATSSRARTRGFTLVEAMISALIVATMMVAALNTVGASARTQSATITSLKGQHMAMLLMTEIESLPYKDPDLIPLLLGVDVGERALDRSTFDDIDDYHGYTQSPVTTRNGTQLSLDAGWAFTVDVGWVDPAAPGALTGTLLESNLKRIEVIVIYKGKPVANLVTLKANVS